ncbi:ABC transporter permease subunit [Desulfosporosinus sp. BICA1-9]|uniref:ABC transporter permease subunit n=1 Tax=Desulfosporosinus sp. BICA1-9 TaxID=1531958 RepID=UPI00054C2208|nr:ABC transporter permease subunit [Desulfosporosinus sp. BICA1-9]KJS88464.1 MAG: phosphonate ABC transporter permease [Desulfosporosinus sp. BICA1-9]HBW34692.1 phosphonate ABC transporter permease [Desulfosporosinus sp.]
MRDDIFSKRRNGNLVFFSLLISLTVGSIIITQYDVLKGFTSIYKAIIWGGGNFYPDAKSMRILPEVLPKLQETVLMAIAATTVAAFFALFLSLAGSKTTRLNRIFGIVSRGIASLFRNIPLVAWAMVLMLAFSQSPLTGYFALFFYSLGFLTRAFMETLEEVGNNSIEGLQATGAGYFHIIFQAVLPSSLPQMISWLLYNIEHNIRDATLVGILTGTGIGFSFDLYYKRFDYHAASLVVILIVITVIFIEFVSNNIRRVIL